MGRANETPQVSADVFDNPAARAFASELAREGDLSLVSHMLGKLVGLSEDVELPDCQTAVAAAAVVLALLEPGQVDLPPELARKLDDHPRPHRELVGLAAEALERVRDGSEVAEALTGEALISCRRDVDALLARFAPVLAAPLMEPEGAAVPY